MPNADPFSMSTMINSLQHLRFASATDPIDEYYRAVPPPRCIPAAIPPPGDGQYIINSFPDGYLTPQSLFDIMTISDEQQADAAPFKEMISRLDRRQLQRMASLLTSDSDYLMKIARNKNGSHRLKKLLGKSDDVDNLFSAVILRRFLHVMTDKHASYVAIRGMHVFNEANKESIYKHTLHHALQLARDQHGCITLNEIITDLEHPYYRNQLLELVAHNALFLSRDPYGNFVVQHVLKLNDLHCTYNIAVNLCGNCVELSFKKYGSYIVETLLETEESMVVVVAELLQCEGDRLMRLARSEYGNFVVAKALRVTQEAMNTTYLFWGLVHMLMPFRHLLRRSRAWSQFVSFFLKLVNRRYAKI